MPPNDKLSFTVEFKAGDTKGIKAVDEFSESLDQARQELKDAKKEGGINGIAVGAEDLDVANRKLNALAGEANLVRKELVEARAEMVKFGQTGGDEFEKAEARAARLEAAFDSLKQSARGLPLSIEAAARSGGDSGIGGIETDLSQNLGAVAQGANALGFTQLGDTLDLGSGAAGALDILKALPDTFDTLGQSLLKNEGLIGGFAQAGADLAAKVFPSMAAGAAGFLTVAAPIALTIGAITVALALFAKGISDAGNAARDAAAANTEEARRQVELNRLIEAGDTDSLSNMIQQAQDDFDAASAAFADTAALADDAAQRQQDAALNLLNGSGEGNSIDIFGTGAELSNYNQELERNLDAMQGAQATLDDYTAALAAAEEQAARNAEIAGQVDALDRQMQIQREVNQLIESGSQEQLDARRRQIQQEIDLINSLLPDYQALAGTSEEAAARVEELQGQLAYYNELNVELTENEAAITAAREEETGAINRQISALQNRISLEQEIIQMSRDATVEQVEARQQAIADEIAAIESVLPELEAMAATSEEAAAELERTNDRLAQLRTESSRLANEVEPEARRRQIEEGEAAAQDAVEESEARIGDIREKAGQRAIELEQDRQKAIIKANADSVKAIQDLNNKVKKDIGNENKKFFEDEKKALEKFHKQVEQEESNNKKERLRAVEDLQDALLDAEADNDVEAYIRAKREGKKNLDRMAEDTSEEARLRQEQFFEERRAAEEAHKERLEQIEESRKVEAAAIEERRLAAVQQANDTFNEQNQRLQQQTQMAIQREQEALQRTLQNIQQKYNLETQIAQQAAQAIGNAFIQMANAVSAAAAAGARGSASQRGDMSNARDQVGVDGAPPSRPGQAPPPRSTPPPRTSGGFGSGNRAAGGGAVNTRARRMAAGGEFALMPAGRERTVGLTFEGNYPEGIIPLEPTRLAEYFKGVFPTSSGGDTYNFNGDVTVNGEGVSKRDVETALTEGFYRFAAGVQRRRAGNG